MAKSAGGAGRAGRAKGLNFATMSPQQVVNVAKTQGVTDVGQLNNAQRRALKSALKRGELWNYPTIWPGKNRLSVGPALPRRG